MKELLNISAEALCRILSTDPEKLSSFERALREALEKENSPEELKSIKEKACVEGSLGTYQVTQSGKPQLL